ncbi:amino acid ABC transporter permease [Acidaminobacter sp. JC074]|uniref:amino acid ABC transporter permease n=1 Tax=Acidaminobacter sp. JC074 TaxID=2530199 RepID=UPI001F0F7F05|nr:amino acid ABC transporter permease [Acidaminobacter sp. JC074]MCH4886721.1 amino acid ABC transporter permease [Acidaminobacter sp. JC074]
MSGFDFLYLLRVLPVILQALPITISIGTISMVFGLVLGLLITFLRRSNHVIVVKSAEVYVSYFRGTPLMVQLFIFFFGLPQLFPVLSQIDAYFAAIIVLSINASAYISEVMKSSIDAVDYGQYEAALSVGMSNMQAMERIILPQAFKIAVLPLGNTFISLIQGTAVTFMIGLKDIMGVAKVSSAASYRFFEAFLAVGFIYWILTLIITKLINILAFKLSKGGVI